MAAVSVVMYLEPASAVVWAAIFLEETPNAMAWIGVALVIFGGMVAATATGKEQDAIGAQAAL
jgi:drug/metabolite transporter (DMT)-like permease